MREIRNILSLGKVEAIQVTIDCDFIRFLTSLLTNPNEELRIEAVWYGSYLIPCLIIRRLK